MTNEKDTFFSEENEAKSSWFKFNEIGDSIKGQFLRSEYKEATGNFNPQYIYTLLTQDGEEVIVPMAESKKMVVNAMKRAVEGQEVGFKYDSDYQSEDMKKSGFAPAKTIKCYMGEAPAVKPATTGVDSVDTMDVSEVFAD